MFPIRDARGRVIAFGGRMHRTRASRNTSTRPRRRCSTRASELYGLYEARQSRQRLNRLLIVEGYMDVVRLHQAGIHVCTRNARHRHDRRASRIASSASRAEVVFCFDGDRAGRAAAWRALENALPQAREGRQIRFLFLPEGHDPDSLVGEEGREAFERRLDGAMPLSEYFIGHLASQVDLEHVDGRARLRGIGAPAACKSSRRAYIASC